ncbi:MAG TPA: winged helix-turn-helix domain-containing protein [Blastocatellia bacterium]|nr:winged helix-turn-helix domain-containing protein [Blastocatellia bacterium]
MPKKPKHFYRFGAFTVDATNRLLMRDGQPVSITLKALDTLLVLLESRGQIVEKDELMRAVWPDAVVEENNLNQQISTLRKLMGEGPDGKPYIETIPRRGYRFVAQVSETWDEDSPAVTAAEPAVVATTDSVSVAPPGRRFAARRWQAVALLVILAAAGTGVYFWSRPTPQVRSIAVLPFKPLADGNNDVYLKLGIADTLITRLSSIKSLTVRPTSSILRYADIEQDPAESGRSLKVDAVLEGRFQLTSGEEIKVTVQLIRASDGALLWGEKFVEPLTNILRLQDSISERVVSALALNLTGEERQSLARQPTKNTEAYQLYLKGRYYWYKWTPEGWKRAQEYFKQAIDKDPDYALAYAGLADAYGVMAFVTPIQNFFEAWKQAASKALELDSALPEAHIAMGALKFFGEWDRHAAEAEIIRAIELNPNNALAHDVYAIILGAGGQADRSIEEARRAQELDPLSPYMNTDFGMAYYYARRLDEALNRLNGALEIDPNHVDAINYLGEVYERKGLYAQAVTQWQKSLTITGDAETAKAMAQAYDASGYRGALQAWLAKRLQQSKLGYVPAMEFAALYVRLGDKAKAIEYLQKALAEKAIWLNWIDVEPRWDSLRSEEEFKKLLDRISAERNPPT